MALMGENGNKYGQKLRNIITGANDVSEFNAKHKKSLKNNPKLMNDLPEINFAVY